MIPAHRQFPHSVKHIAHQQTQQGAIIRTLHVTCSSSRGPFCSPTEKIADGRHGIRALGRDVREAFASRRRHGARMAFILQN
jgi:hypothetical protein